MDKKKANKDNPLWQETKRILENADTNSSELIEELVELQTEWKIEAKKYLEESKKRKCPKRDRRLLEGYSQQLNRCAQDIFKLVYH